MTSLNRLLSVAGISGVRKWISWLREDLGSRPHDCLKPDFIHPSPFLVVKDPLTETSKILVEPHLKDADFRKAWMLFFCRSGHLVVTVDSSWILPVIFCLLDLHRITGRDLQEVARAKKSAAGGMDGWAWNEVKALPLLWFSDLAILLEPVESTGVWPQGLLDAYVAMIPEVGGDSTPLGQRPLCVLPIVYRLWASLRLGHLREWVEGWLPKSIFSLGNGLSPVEVWFSLEGVSCMSWLLMSLSPLTPWIGPFWTVLWVGWACQTGLGRPTFPVIVRFVSGSILRLALVSLGVKMMVFLRVVLRVWFFLLLCMFRGVVILRLFLLLSLSFMLTISNAVRSVLVPFLMLCFGRFSGISGILVVIFILPGGFEGASC